MNRSRLVTPGLPEQHFIHQGSVACPVRGKVDMEICLYCPFVRDIELDVRPARIRCCPPAELTDAERKAWARLTVLELADILGNVSEACRIRGITRKKFYEYKERYRAQGLAGLMDRPKHRQRFIYGTKARH